MFIFTSYVVAVGLDVSGEVGVLGDGGAVVVQRRELRGDICVSRHKDSRQDWRRRDAFFKDPFTDSKAAIAKRLTHSVSPPSGSGRG